MRIVSLVPSLTETVAELGAGERLVGVTRYCDVGAPEGAERVGGTKNPDVEAIARLRPDVVLANAEENRAADLEALRAAGVEVHVTFPRRVSDVAPMVRRLGAVVGAGERAEALAARLDAVAGNAGHQPGSAPRALILVWRRPWMAAGADTYAADVLRTSGFAVPLDRGADRYPRLEPGDRALAAADVVLLPSEPYAFGPADLPAVRGLAGEVPAAFVDGRLLTWHGSRTLLAVETFAALAAQYVCSGPG